MKTSFNKFLSHLNRSYTFISNILTQYFIKSFARGFSITITKNKTKYFIIWIIS